MKKEWNWIHRVIITVLLLAIVVAIAVKSRELRDEQSVVAVSVSDASGIPSQSEGATPRHDQYPRGLTRNY